MRGFLSFLLKAALVLVGGFMILLGVSLFIECVFEDPMFGGAVAGAIFAAGGVACIVLMTKIGKRDAAGAQGYGVPGRTYGPAAGYNASVEVVEATPVAGASVAQAQSSADAPARTAPAGGTAAVEQLLQRSDDVIATLSDLVSHGDDAGAIDLVALLSRAGIVDWTDAPNVSATHLVRSGRWWLNFDASALAEGDYERLVATEAALNVAQDAAELGTEPLDARVNRVLRGTIDLAPVQGNPIAAIIGSRDGGEWAYRLRFSDYAENAQVPFRLTFDLVANLDAGVVDIRPEVPAPQCVAPFFESAADRARAARAYALRIALACARFAFEASPRVSTVQVRCYVRGDERSVLYLKLTPVELAAVADAARSPEVDAGSFPQADCIFASFDETGWFEPIADPSGLPLIEADVIDPPSRHRACELDGSACSRELAAATGAARVFDLGINENAGRMAAWREIADSLDGTTEGLVSKLVQTRDAASDLTVVEACERVSKALVDGKLDAGDEDLLARTFVFGGALDAIVDRAQEALENPEEHNPEEALAALTGALGPIMQTGLYLDDSETVYRYFNSTADRIAFNLDIDDRTRAVRLVPDSYYRAHSLAARLLMMMNRMAGDMNALLAQE